MKNNKTELPIYGMKKTKKIMKRLRNSVGASNLVLYYPLSVKEASGCDITDIDGNKYLDFLAGWTVAVAGYAHPKINKSITTEIKKRVGISAATFPNETSVEFAEKLISITPGNFKKKVWFGHSGTDACAAAYKMFPLATNKPRIISFHGGMHGIDVGGLAMSAIPGTAKYPIPNLVTKVPYATCYRCPFGLEYPSCNIHCASDFIEDQVFKYTTPPEDVSFMIVEPIQSDSGDAVPPIGYLEKLKKTCDKFGILFVSDEVKIGLGRTGKMFGIEHEPNVIPDAIVLGKSLASGIPSGALITKSELIDSGFAGQTLSGNSISAASGLATLDIINDEKLIDNADKMGKYMKKRLEELMKKHEIIGDIRGRGLILGIELVKNRKTKEPAKKETGKVVYRAWQLGLLTAFLGPNSNVIEITPPLIITSEQIDKGIEILDRALSDVKKGLVSDSDIEGFVGF